MKTTLALALFLLPAPAAWAAPYYNAALHYSLELPAGWTDIPANQLARFKAAGGGDPLPLAAGFQDVRNPWFTLPYVLIHHQPATGESVSEIAADLERRAAEKLPDAGSPQTEDTRFALPTADPARGVVLLPFVSDRGNGPRIQGVSAIFPGRNGVVNLSFVAQERTFERDWAAFKPALDTFRYDAEYGFRPADHRVARARRWAAQHPAQVRVAVLLAGLAGLVFILLLARAKPRRPLPRLPRRP